MLGKTILHLPGEIKDRKQNYLTVFCSITTIESRGEAFRATPVIEQKHAARNASPLHRPIDY